MQCSCKPTTISVYTVSFKTAAHCCISSVSGWKTSIHQLTTIQTFTIRDLFAMFVSLQTINCRDFFLQRGYFTQCCGLFEPSVQWRLILFLVVGNGELLEIDGWVLSDFKKKSFVCVLCL